MEKAFRVFRSYGQPMQELNDHIHYAVKRLDFGIEKLSEDATGLKVMMGGEGQEQVICFDVDMKADKDKGLEVVKQLVKDFPIFKETRSERTKSGGYHFFLLVPFEKYRKISKVIFNRPYGELAEDGVKPTEIEVFFNAPITVAPTKTKDGDYVLNPKTDAVKRVTEEELQAIMRRLKDTSYDTKIINVGGVNKQRGEIDVNDRNSRECIEIFEKNNIRYRVGKKFIQVWSNDDTSANGDYIVNENKMLWNLKDYTRISVKDFIKRENGKYIEREINFEKLVKEVCEFFEGEVIQ